jgi:hypothetical protein
MSALVPAASEPEALGEPRAELMLAPSWLFRVYRRDAELILRALGDRLVTDEERAQARDLGDRLTALRAQGIAQMNVGAQIAVDHMAAARAADGLTIDPLAKPKRGEA